MNCSINKIYLAFVLILITNIALTAQLTKIKGRVKDAETDEPISYASVFIKNSNIATYTNDSGFYSLAFKGRHDSLTVTFLGYKPKSEKFKRNISQIIDFSIYSNTTKLDEIVITPGENPAHRILREIWKHKEFNNRKSHNIKCKQFNTIKISLSNIDEKFKQRKVLKPFQFVFENVDTNAYTGKVYLPILITETASEYVYQNNPPVEQEKILGTQVSGIKNESVLDFVGGLNQSIDFYKDYMTFYTETGFISPIADAGLLFYRYYLTDSAVRSGHKCYHLTFKPRRKQDRTFAGEFWVADTTFAITELNMRINPEANINFLSDMFAEYYYTPFNDSVWLLQKEHLQTDLNLIDSKSVNGLQGDKTTIYSDYKLNQPVQEDSLSNITNAGNEADSTSNPDFWKRNRPVKLSTKDEKIYKMVDSVKNVPAFRTLYDVLTTIFDAHYSFGKFKIGPYFSLYSYNKVEGHRFRIGGTTTATLSDKYKFTTYLAWGSYDKEFKYYGSLIWVLNRNPRICLNTTYKHDVSQVNIAPDNMSNENIISSVLRRNPYTKLQMINNFNSTLETDIIQGINNTLGFNFMRVFPGPYIPIETTQGTKIKYISTSEVTLGFHLEEGQRFLQSKFRRKRIRNNNPAFDIKLIRSIPKILASHYNYWKCAVVMSQFVDASPFGFNRYSIEASKTFGTVPWPLLDVFRGNETYGNNKLAFNMMNSYEFIADQFVTVTTEQHLQGMILNYIPLLRKLRLREVLIAKAVAGKLHKRNTQEITLPPGMNALEKPYIEVGVGVENILKALRIDAMWRLTQTRNPDIEIFGLRARLQLML